MKHLLHFVAIVTIAIIAGCARSPSPQHVETGPVIPASDIDSFLKTVGTGHFEPIARQGQALFVRGRRVPDHASRLKAFYATQDRRGNYCYNFYHPERSDNADLIQLVVDHANRVVAFQCLRSGQPWKAPTVRYRLIGQIVAYHTDGGVSYSDCVAATGVPSVRDGDLILKLPKANGTVRVVFRRVGNRVVFVVQGVETTGKLNSWTRLKKQNGGTFGPDTECEIWFGTTEPRK